MKRELTFLEKAVFPSDKLWIASYLEGTVERFEIRTNDDESYDGARTLWEGHCSFGNSFVNFTYLDLSDIRNQLPRLEELIAAVNELPYGDPKTYEEEGIYYDTFLNLFDFAMGYVSTNPYLLPLSLEIMKLYIVHDHGQAANLKAFKRTLSSLEKKQKLFTNMLSEIFAADTIEDRLSKYIHYTQKSETAFPALHYGPMTLEPRKRTKTGMPNDLPGRYHRFYKMGDETAPSFVADVQNTDEIDTFYGFLISRYLLAQMKAKVCKCCGRYFVPISQKNSAYCDRQIEGSTKTCREMGSARVYEQKKLEDPAVRAYKRAYKTHYARISYGIMTRDEFDVWAAEARSLRDDCITGKLSLEEYEKWLEQDRIK